MWQGAEPGPMVKYQFEIDDEKWNEWKNTVPRSKSLENRIIELIEADTEGRVQERGAREDGSPSSRPAEPAPQLGEQDVEEPEPVGIELPSEEEISDDVWAAVDTVADGWDDDSRLENRRLAAATTLQYALTHDVHLGKSSDVVEAVREKYPVEGQSAETWWRKNVRDVLKEFGEYSKAQHGYAVESLEVQDA